MRIAVDVDGVLLKTYELFLTKFNNEYGTSFKHKDLKSWFWWEALDCVKDRVTKTFKELSNDSWDSLKTYVMGGFYLLVINKMDTVDLLTDRKYIPDSLDKVVKFLDKNHIRRGECYNKAVDSDGINKVKFDYDLFIDDNPFISVDLKPDQYLILFDQPWNQNVLINKAEADAVSKRFDIEDLGDILIPKSNVVRAKTWGEVFNHYVKIKKEYSLK